MAFLAIVSLWLLFVLVFVWIAFFIDFPVVPFDLYLLSIMCPYLYVSASLRFFMVQLCFLVI